MTPEMHRDIELYLPYLSHVKKILDELSFDAGMRYLLLCLRELGSL
jgi:hypothetical protein